MKVTALTRYLLIFYNVRHFLFIAVQWAAVLLHIQEIPGSNPNPRIAILTAFAGQQVASAKVTDASNWYCISHTEHLPYHNGLHFHLCTFQKHN
jgi:hypothetical protein